LSKLSSSLWRNFSSSSEDGSEGRRKLFGMVLGVACFSWVLGIGVPGGSLRGCLALHYYIVHLFAACEMGSA
jgi:hypothetical protein